MENRKNKAGQIWEEAEKGKQYQESMGFRKEFPEIIRFKEGEQWPAPTSKTKNFPRPVFNITEMFIRNKRATITNQGLTISYSPLEVDEAEDERARKGAEAYGNFSKVVWENVDQDELNDEFLDDAITLGTGILHYYWDGNAKGGGKLKYIGDTKGEIIDVLNIRFANPRNKKVQEQDWIIIETRMTVKDAKALAKANGVSALDMELIQPDEYRHEYDNDNKNRDDDSVTVLTKYFKKDGIVFYSKSTRSVMLVPERELAPVSEIPEEVEGEEQETERPRITLYPIVVLTYKRRKKCIYGVGEAQDIITINKLYNQLKGMTALNVIRNGNPNILTKKGAIKQQLTNEGGQIITDYFVGGGDGVKYMQPPNFSGEFSKIAAEIFEMARTITGNTEVSTGEALGANMAASAIIALQNQAKNPIKEMQQRFYSAMKEVGDIWCQFYKTYYSTTRLMSVEKDNGIETQEFRGIDYADVDFKTKVEVTTSTEKETLTMSTLENMKAAKEITKQQYVELAPESVIPIKSKLKEMWESEETERDLLAKAMEQIKGYQQLLGETPNINQTGGDEINEMQTMSNGDVY